MQTSKINEHIASKHAKQITSNLICRTSGKIRKRGDMFTCGEAWHSRRQPCRSRLSMSKKKSSSGMESLDDVVLPAVALDGTPKTLSPLT